MGKTPETLNDQLGLAVGKRSYEAYCDLITSARCKRIFNAGGRPQRLLFATTGTKDPKASDVLYIKALAAPLTVNTMPESTLVGRAPVPDQRRRTKERDLCGLGVERPHAKTRQTHRLER
jgi:transaldolase